MEAREPAVAGGGQQCFRHHGEGAARAGEPAVLRKASEFNRALARAWDFVDRMRNLRVGNVRLVSGVVEEDRFVLQRVIDPGGELFAPGDGAGWIVRITKVNEVHFVLRNFRHEIVGRGARQINQLLVRPRFVRRARVAGHDVGIHIDRIDRVLQGDFVLVAENVENVCAIAFRAVGHKNFVVGNVQPAVAIIVLRNRAPQKIVALFGAVTVEGFPVAHFVHGLVQGVDDRRRQRFGHIADAAANQAFGGSGVLVAKDFNAPGDFREQVARFQFQIMMVQVSHFNCQW